MKIAKASDNPPVLSSEEAYDFDDIFGATHGIGDAPVAVHGGSYDSPVTAVVAMIDPQAPNLKEIRFCKYIIRGDNHTEAYVKAFEFKGDEHPRLYFAKAAYALLKRPRVAIKLQEMHQKLVEFEEQDMVDIIAEINEDRKLARDLGQPGAALAAVKLKAELLGHKQKVAPVTNNVNLVLSDEQKRAMIARITGGHSEPIDVTPIHIEDAEIVE
jgi:hypothetical protein